MTVFTRVVVGGWIVLGLGLGACSVYRSSDREWFDSNAAGSAKSSSASILEALSQETTSASLQGANYHCGVLPEAFAARLRELVQPYNSRFSYLTGQTNESSRLLLISSACSSSVSPYCLMATAETDTSPTQLEPFIARGIELLNSIECSTLEH